MKRIVLFLAWVLVSCSGAPQPEPQATSGVQSPPNESQSDNTPELATAQAKTLLASVTAFSKGFPKFLSRSLTQPTCREKTKVPRWTAPPNNIWPSAAGEAEIVGAPIALVSSFKAVGTAGPKDGVVRVRAAVDGALNLKVWARSSGSGASRQGVSIDMAGDTIALTEHVGGKARQLVAPQPVYRFDRRKSLELVLTFFGKHIIAQVYDGDSGLELLSLYTTTHVEQPGETVVESAKNPVGNMLTYFGQRASCSGSRGALGKVKPVVRYFSANNSQVEGLSLKVQKHLRMREASQDGEFSTWEADLLTLEQAHCGGVDMWDVKVEPPFKFQDADYARYRLEPPVRAASGFRSDLSYQSPAMVERMLRGYAAEFPEYVRLEQIGTTHQGRPIWALAIGAGVKVDDRRPSILLNGAHHGDEPLSVTIVLDAIQELLVRRNEPETKKWLDELVIWAVPMVNPDGAEFFLEQTRFGGRKNGRDSDSDGRRAKREGVDLNRNYPIQWGSLGDESALTSPFGKWYRGPSSGSEPETQAIMNLAERERFAASISYHTGTVCILAPYTVENMQNPEPNEAWDIATTLSKAMGTQIDGRPFKVRKNIYPVEGIDQDWMRFAHGTVALLIEAVGRTPGDFCGRRDALLPNRLAWQALLRRTVSGSVIVGNAVRANGKAVSVEFRHQGQEFKNGEVLSTRPRDGLFVRYVSPGVHRFEVDDRGKTFSVEAAVEESPVHVILELP